MISSVANPAIVRVRRLRKRLWRERTGRFIVEGHRSVAPGIPARRIEDLFHTPAAARLRPGLIEAARDSGATVREVTPEVMGHLTSVATTPDVLGVARIRELALDAVRETSFVVMVDVHDPATAGSIAATATSGGVGAIVFADRCVDAFAPKVVRAAAGAHLVSTIVRRVALADAISAARARGCRVIVIAEKGDHPWDHALAGPIALVLSGAEPGPSGADVVVAAPSSGPGPNLAVRAGVVLYEWMRQGAEPR